MTPARLAALALLAGPLWPAQSYYLTDALTSIDLSKWTTVGALVPGTAGLAAPDTAGGSLISRLPVPDGSAEAEVRMTLRLAASGGTYTEFMQATADARTGGPGGGTHLAFEMQNPRIDSQGHCVATFLVLQSVAGVTTLLSSFPHSCRDGMVIRMAVHGGVALLWPDEAAPLEFAVAASGTGSPGIGAYGTPTGNSISEVQLGAIHRTALPAIDKQRIGVSVFRNRVDVQWPPVADDPAGVGLSSYWIARDGQYFMRTSATMFQDLGVRPGETHTYSIAAVDQHYNFSPPVSFTASTPVPQNGPPPGNLPKPPKLPR
jgi:hypothetical protein